MCCYSILCFKSVAGISIEGSKGSTDIEIYGTENKVDVQYNTYHGKDPFTHVNFKKSDIKMEEIWTLEERLFLLLPMKM